ncbi:7936_t:CDS:1, partial [Cetraspora pellucida]
MSRKWQYWESSLSGLWLQKYIVREVVYVEKAVVEKMLENYSQKVMSMEKVILGKCSREIFFGEIDVGE